MEGKAFPVGMGGRETKKIKFKKKKTKMESKAQSWGKREMSFPGVRGDEALQARGWRWGFAAF